MKVHLIKTPEYDQLSLEGVSELLNTFDGPLEFILNDFNFNTSQFPYLAVQELQLVRYMSMLEPDKKK
ncbi:MAG: hypothetical protein LH629_06760 [Ignavibacteria bacterium]|nr:hypothetical protein [Ignavibacteria bacterium]